MDYKAFIPVVICIMFIIGFIANPVKTLLVLGVVAIPFLLVIALETVDYIKNVRPNRQK